MSAQIEAETAALREAEANLAQREQALAESEKRLAELEEASENAKQQIIQAMNRLGDVRSQRARLSAMQTALENQLKSMEADRAREETG